MIGRWLDTITPEMEERLLTCSLQDEDRGYAAFTGDGCLLQVAYGTRFWHDKSPEVPRTSYRWTKDRRGLAGHGLYLWDQYDRLLRRYPPERIQHAIRLRVLRNQLRRALGTKPEAVVEVRKSQMWRATLTAAITD